MDNPQISIKLSKEPNPALEPRNRELFVEKHNEAKQMRSMRDTVTIFTLLTFLVLLIFTMIIILFQGFKFHGFELESGLLKWLGASTIGEIGGLITLVYWFFFKKR